MKLTSWMVAAAVVAALAFAAPLEGQESASRRGWLGISYMATSDNGVETVRVERVYPGSPAAAAGLRNGDEIVRWNGSADVEGALETLRLAPGDTVRLRIRRGSDRDRDMLVIAGDRPRQLAVIAAPRAPRGMSQDEWEKLQEALRANTEEFGRLFGENGRMRAFRADSLARIWEGLDLDNLAIHADSLHKGIQLMLRDSLGPRLEALGDEVRILFPQGPTRTVIALGNRSVAGAEFEEMNEGLSRYFGTDEGLLVLRVSQGTPAARAGLRPGDVVLEVNEREADSVDDVRDAVARAQGSRTRSVLLEVVREGRRQELDLRWE